MLLAFCFYVFIQRGGSVKPLRSFLKVLTLIPISTIGFAEIDEELWPKNDVLNSTIYLALVILVNFYSLNLFITILCVHFSVAKEEVSGQFWSIEEMLEYYKRKFWKCKEKKPEKPSSEFCHKKMELIELTLDREIRYLETFFKKRRCVVSIPQKPKMSHCDYCYLTKNKVFDK